MAAETTSMTASVRTLIVLAVLVVVLGFALAVDPHHAPTPPPDRALISGFDPGSVTELAWTRPSARPVRLVRAHETWNVVDPAGDVDPDTVGNLLAALRGGRWQRRSATSAAGQVHSTLEITTGGSKHVIAIGDPLIGADQAWLVIGDSAVLVDGWIARALDPAPLALRIRHPLEAAAQADAIQLTESLRVEGHPRRVVWVAMPSQLRGGGSLLLDETLAVQLERTLSDLEFVALPDAPLTPRARTIRLEQPAVELHDAGACPGRPDLVAVITSRGNGCVATAPWTAILALIDRLDTASSSELVERRLAQASPKVITFASHGQLAAVLDTSKAIITIAGVSSPADRERVHELQQALLAPCDITTLQHADTLGVLLVPDEVSLLTNGIALRGETALRPHPEHWKILIRPPSAYRDDTRWIEDPTAITAITIEGTRYSRGAVIGEWTRTPPGAVDASRIEALAAVLATVRAPPTDAKLGAVRRVTLTITPPVGASTTHELELGPGCVGRIDGAMASVPPAICAAVTAVH